MRLYSKSASCNWDTKAIDIAAFPFEKTAIIIAILGQKAFNWLLNKDILSCMQNHNFGAINQVSNEEKLRKKVNIRNQIELSLKLLRLLVTFMVIAG